MLAVLSDIESNGMHNKEDDWLINYRSSDGVID